MAEDRDVRLRVGVEAEGDTDVFRDQGEQIERLGRLSPEAQQQVSALLTELGSGSEEAGAKLAQLTAQLKFDEEIANVQRLEARWRELTRAIETETDQVRLDRLEQEAEEVGQEMLEAGNKATRALRQIRTESDRAEKSLSGVADVGRRFNQILATAGFAVGAHEIGQFARESATAALELERYRKQLQAAAQDQEVGNELFAFAQEQAERLGFDLGTLVQRTSSFIASTRDSNLTLSQRVEVLLRTFEAARVLNLEEQRLSNTLVGIGQVAGKGTVAMQELREQIGENLPGAVQILAKELDISTKELFKLVETGELLSEEALPALSRGFEKTFSGDVPAALETGAASVDRFLVRWKLVKAELGEGFVAGVQAAGNESDQFFDDLETGASSAAQVIGSTLTVEVTRFVEGLQGLRLIGALVEGGVAGLVEELHLLGDATQNQQESTIALIRAQETAEERARRLAAQAAKLAAAQREASQDIFGNREELQAQTTAVVGAIRALGDLEGQTTAQTAAAREAIRELVDGYEALGVTLDEIPEPLRALADQYGVTSSAAEDHAKRSERAAKAAAKAEKEAAKQRVQDLRSIADAYESLIERTRQDGGGREGIQGDLEDLERQRKELQTQPTQNAEDLQRIDELTERISDLKKELQEAGTAADGWSQETLASSDEVEAAISQVIDSLRGTFGQLNSTQQQIVEQTLSNLQRAGEQGGASASQITHAFETVSSVLRSSGDAVNPLQEALDRVQGKGLDVGRAFDSIRESVTGVGEDAQQAGQAVVQAGESVAQGAAAAEAGSERIENVGGVWQQVGRDVEEGAISIRRAGEDVEATSLGVQKAGESARGAGEDFQALGEGASEAGAGAQEAVQPFEEWVEEAGRLKGEVDEGSISIKRHREETEGAATAAEKASQATGEAAESAGKLAEGTERSAEGLRASGEASEDAAAGLKKVADQSTAAGEATAQAAQGSQDLSRGLDNVSQQSEGLTDVASAMERIAAVDLSNVIAQLGQMSTALSDLASKAEEAADRINEALRVDDDDEGAPPLKSSHGPN